MISDVYDSLVTAFKQYDCPAEVFLGGQFLEQHTAPMRVVLWQDADTYSEALPSLKSYGYNYIDPRPVKTRNCGVVAQLWATAPEQRNPSDQYRANLAYLDALVNQTIVAIQQKGAGLYTLQGGRAADLNADATVAGLGYELRFSVAVPVIDVRWPDQQLSKCSETWSQGRATAIVTIAGKVDPEPPYFQDGTTFPVPGED